MGADAATLGYTITTDPSPADAASEAFSNREMERVERLKGASADAAGDIDKGLLSNKESARLLTEELGIHMPRAVTGAVAEMLPEIGSLGGALLGAFAVKEVVKFGEEVYKAAKEASGMVRAQKEMAEAVNENTAAIEAWARSSSHAAHAELDELDIRIAKWRAALDARWAYFASENIVSYAMQFYLGEVGKTEEGEKKLTEMQKEHDKIVNILKQDVTDEASATAAAEAKKQEAWERSTEESYEYYAKRRKQSQDEFEDAVRLSEKLIAAEDRTREVQEQVNAFFQEQAARMAHENEEAITKGLEQADRRIREQFKQLEEHAKQLRIEWANAHPLAANITEDLKSMGIEAKNTSVAKMELTAVTAQFTRAATEEVMAVQKNIAASGEQLAAGLAGLIGGRRAQAAVEAVWETARGIACIAEGSWPPNPAAIIAAGLHFEAAAQYAMVAGSGGHRRSASGAGVGSDRSVVAHSEPGSGAGAGVGNPGQALAPGAAGPGGMFSGTARVVVFGTDHELQNWVAGAVNAAVSRGVSVTSTTSQRGAPVGH
jgi:hypothetical protein